MDANRFQDVEALLQANREAELLRFTTAGSVDDGKSTLIGRLLSDSKSIYDDQLAALNRDSRRLNRDTVDLALLTDGLKAEREQGITIDVAYRYFSTPRRRFIIADTPGHVQYTRNMATGASTAHLAIILIDARHGVLTQSRRHGFIASLLGIRHLVVCVNKMDLVGYRQETFEQIRNDYAAFSAKFQVPDILYLPVSALHGDNVVTRSDRMPWYEGPPLLAHLERVEIGGDRNLIDFRFPVQLVNRPTPDFRGFCGQVASGVVRVGDELLVRASGKRTRVKSIITFAGEQPAAAEGQSVTLCLEDEIDISRGDLLCPPHNMPQFTREVEAMMVWMSETPLRPGAAYLIRHTTRTLRGTVSTLRYRVDPDTLHRQPAETLGLNEIGRVAIECFQPIAWDPYAANRTTGALILIDPQTNATVAAGMLIDRLVQSESRALGAARPLRRETSLVSLAERTRLTGARRPVTVWLSGLSGSGKTTVAKALERRLYDDGVLAILLDGDNIRHGLNRDLDFTERDRAENIRRIAEVAVLFNEAGLVVVAAFISPYAADRAMAREIIGPARFIEVFVDTPLSVCEERDVKGLYRRARAGEIPSFTGVSAPYEPPEHPDVRIDTSALTVENAVAEILGRLDGGHS